MDSIRDSYKRITQNLWITMFLVILRRIKGGGGMCANRYWKVFQLATMEITVTMRDRSHPDGYSREDLMAMLRKVRKAEKEQNWKCPDPLKQEVETNG